ncbi:MAG TPA: L-serine ammonia-lyase [Parachlamydiales bacterium]|nr:MAG: L-serine ammonia-lyase [Chlamydiae bacterium GWA2_50_15]OGN71716.1 MAG: L-serine ammonia-lyase [Chlamydiae bacterium RIFCSPLOWO2_12_FULL_49_12]HAZ15683.1 L-serine ammonia-lyase [Parachlamydiales bacterium]
MTVSLFDLFSVGIGPSSSHTVGPMRAARRFSLKLKERRQLKLSASVTIDLFGSLAMTGIGHGIDKALLLGLEGHTPEGVDPASIPGMLSYIAHTGVLNLLGCHPISFSSDEHLIFNKGKRLPFHSNAMRFVARDFQKNELLSQIYYSTGGGFIVEHEKIHDPALAEAGKAVPFPFETAAELLEHCRREKRALFEIILENEKSWRSEEGVKEGIYNLWKVMQGCVKRGLHQTGVLPGGLRVERRAAKIYRELLKCPDPKEDPALLFDWVSLFALAVNEENAAGGRVVTAPTNGAAGVIPSVLHYYHRFTPNPSNEGIVKFFLTAAAIGMLYKARASISAAEMGCQGEIGVACSMAAGGLTAALEGSNAEIENAAEIGMEHNLGLTCDPVNGLVQIPCIERNTMGAVKAINASRLALRGEGNHRVSLDQVIQAMRHTGEDMKSAYKETSEGGLALFVPLNLPEC